MEARPISATAERAGRTGDPGTADRAYPDPAESAPPTPGPAGPADRQGRSATLSSLRAQRILSSAAVKLAPAIVSGVIVYSRTQELGIACLVALSVFVACAAVERRRLPLHLMPLGGIAARFLAPLAGVVGALVLSLPLDPLPVSALLSALLGAWLVLGVVILTTNRLQRGLRIRLALVGSAQLAGSLEAEIQRARLIGHTMVGWVDHTDGPVTEVDLGPGRKAPRRLGALTDLGAILEHENVDLLVYGVRESGADAAGGRSTIQGFATASEACLRSNVRMIGANQLYEELFGHLPLATMNAAWFQYVLHPRFRSASPLRNRAFDLLVSVPLALLVSPLLAVCAVIIRLTDRGPVLYRQRRIGEGGREFEILKLRTMRTDAEPEGAPVWSPQGDDRVTRVGRWLRRNHVDELPQLWNVIRGEMSLVGPRPERPEFVSSLERKLPFYDRRQLMRPGLTGWAQVRVGYAGSEAGTAWKLAHDLYYFKHRSIELDALILLETLVTPVRDSRVSVHLPDERFVLEALRGPIV